jgi:predicted ATPase/DNA-binding winged helix-turn-helix (wHTH) protein
MQAHGESICFGPFRLFPAARVLEKNGQPLPIGNRALDILTVLVERAGEVVDHRELIARVWRGLVVCPSNLRVHMNTLRKALNDSTGTARYIANVTGQGYCFVAPIRRQDDPACELPPVLERIFGREHDVRTIAEDVMRLRFVTVVGPGGMGKTTVAVAAAHSLLEEFAGAVCFVDLGAVSDDVGFVATVASALGLTSHTESMLIEHLRAKRMLLVLDTCEHVIDAAASLAERLFNEAPGVHILATSREALRAEGESAFLLSPLHGASAIQLFTDRATASGHSSLLTDTEARMVADICRKLDGMALAIELAATQAGTHGIVGTWNLLQRRHGLDLRGRRTAAPRHQTLRTVHDWSYRLLSIAEQGALRELSALTSPFTLEDAGDLTTIHTLEALIAKSLVSVLTGNDGSVRYCVLETTRAYVLEKEQESDEVSVPARWYQPSWIPSPARTRHWPVDRCAV